MKLKVTYEGTDIVELYDVNETDRRVYEEIEKLIAYGETRFGHLNRNYFLTSATDLKLDFISQLSESYDIMYPERAHDEYGIDTMEIIYE